MEVSDISVTLIVSLATSLFAFALGLITNYAKHRHDISRFKSETCVKLTIEGYNKGIAVAEEFFNLLSKINAEENRNQKAFEGFDSEYRECIVKMNGIIHVFPVHGNSKLQKVYGNFFRECSYFHSSLQAHLNGLRNNYDFEEHLMNAGKLLNDIRDSTSEEINRLFR